MPNLWLIFITGLLTGGLTCMAVQGGLLTATLAQQEEASPGQSRVWSIVAFLATKLFVYTLLGFLLGWLGSFFQFSLKLSALFLGIASVFMLGTALALVEAHPIFRYFIIQPPRFLTRLIRQGSKAKVWFAPASVGALTIFIPCGTTQAMMALSITTKSPWLGALTLFIFVLGTAPLFFFLGYSIDLLKSTLKANFAKIAATLVILLAVWNLNSALVIAGSTVNLQNIWQNIYCTISFCEESLPTAVQPGTSPTITFLTGRYTIDNPVIPVGEPISLTLTNQAGRGCIQAFTIPRLGIQEFVTLGQTKTIKFTAPEQPGELVFSCSMGMYTGKFIVR